MTIHNNTDTPDAKTVYDKEFFVTQSAAQWAPSIILDHLFTMIQIPKTAIDVGCGKGGWLAALKEYCTGGVLGVDGDYVPTDMLLIKPEEFFVADLALPLFPRINKRFDLALSLEVAEHLPESRADSFVQDLTDLADTILFSAAIPLQDGTNHINCQWQSYWAEKFMARGYQPDISLRNMIWDEKRIGNVYRQNIILFTKSDELSVIPSLDVVHPEIYFATGGSILRYTEKETINNVEKFIFQLAQKNNSLEIKEIFQAFREKLRKEYEGNSKELLID